MDVFGDDVHIAARSEALAPIGGIAISHKVQGDISGSPEFKTKYVGQPRLKGVKQKVEVHCIISHGLPTILSGQTKSIIERGKYSWLFNTSLLLVLILKGWDVPKNRTDQIERIAVLPIKNLSQDPDQEYFYDGMTVDLIKALSVYESLQIISSRSTMHYKDSDLPPTTIARDLNADADIEGTVFKEDNEIRMDVTLRRIDGEVWKQEFHQELSGVIGLHAEVAKSIVEQIKLVLTNKTEKQAPSS